MDILATPLAPTEIHASVLWMQQNSVLVPGAHYYKTQVKRTKLFF